MGHNADEAGESQQRQKINLDIRSILHQRGKVIQGEGKFAFDTFHKIANHISADQLYNLFNDERLRIEIKSRIFDHKDIHIGDVFIRCSDARSADEYRNIYSKTFEWYVSQVLMRELHFYGASFSCHIEHAPNGGDFDVIGSTIADLTHIECKSGKLSNIDAHDFYNFLSRVDFLHSSINIFYIDYKGIPEDSDAINMFQYALKRKKMTPHLWQVKSRSNPNTKLYTPTNLPIYLLDSHKNKGSILSNLRHAFNFHYARQALREQVILPHSRRFDRQQFEIMKTPLR